MSLVDEVRAANQAFYRAFEQLSIDAMSAVWAHDGPVSCVHPGWPLASGWDEVRESWVTILRNTADIRFETTEELIDVRGELAWVISVERLVSGRGGGAVLSTNVFRHLGGAWKMIHHHGSTYVKPLKPQKRAGSSTAN